jgi:hypothetical protein
MWLRTLGELEAGPIVQTIFVAILAGTLRTYVSITQLRQCGVLISLAETLKDALDSMLCSSRFG